MNEYLIRPGQPELDALRAANGPSRAIADRTKSAFRASVGLGPVLIWTSPCVLPGWWRCPLVPFAASALAAIWPGLTRTTSSGGGPLRLPDALRRTMGNVLNGT